MIRHRTNHCSQRARSLGEALLTQAALGFALAAGLCALALGGAAGQTIDLKDLQSAAAAGKPGAEFTLGTLSYVGLGIVQDYVAAALWLRRAAQQGNGDAACELGFLYQTGSFAQGPPPPDPDQARSWYEKAAAQGNACGEFGLATLYAMGLSVDADSDHAKALFDKAAAQGFSMPTGGYGPQRLQDYFYSLAYHFAGTPAWQDTVSAKAGGGG